MKVTNVDRILVDIPFGPVAETQHEPRVGWLAIFSEVCRVTTDDGTVGYGETSSQLHLGMRDLKRGLTACLGRNPFELMWDDSLGAGLQMALFDTGG